jgi:nitrite reductase/ring-hydroxylating ferredoxin subunit
MREPGFAQVLPAADLAPGAMRCVEVAGRHVLLCGTPEGVTAVAGICSHAYARLDEGRLRRHRIICPMHGAGFDARTGAVLSGPASEPLQSFACRVSGGFIEVQV